MIVRIINNNDIILENITPIEEELIDKHFSVVDPKARFIDTNRDTNGVYRRYNRKTKRLARPFLNELITYCEREGLIASVIDDRPPSQYKLIDINEINDDFLPDIKLKNYQIDAIKTIWQEEIGIFDVVTGGGKSELIAGIVKSIQCPSVIIAEQRIVVEQLDRRLKLRKVCDEPGLFYAGKRPNGQLVIVGTIQSLYPPKEPKLPKPIADDAKMAKAMRQYEISLKGYKTRTEKCKLLRQLISQCDMMIIDEADLATNSQYKQLFRYWFKGRRRYGMTGTPYDKAKPVEGLFLREHLGSVIFKQNADEVQAEGLIVPIEFYMVAFGNPNNRNDARTFDIATNEEIVYNEDFHLLINQLCNIHPDEGYLILVQRDELGYALRDLIPNAEFIHGKTSSKERPRILKSFEDRETRVLIGGKNVRRGLDLSGGCENMILATGGKLVSEFTQRLGRARRLNKNGKSRVYDFYFLNNKYLYQHSRGRLKAAVDLGCRTTIVFKSGAIDGEKFVRSRYRIPK